MYNYINIISISTTTYIHCWALHQKQYDGVLFADGNNKGNARVISQASMSIRPLIWSMFCFYVRAIHWISSFICRLMQVLKILIGNMWILNLILSISTIFAAAWLTVNNLTRVPSKMGPNDSIPKSVAANSLQVELLEVSLWSQSLWQIFSLSRETIDPHPVALASE